jgi:hypothetical protein
MISDDNKPLSQHCHDLNHLLQQFPQLPRAQVGPHSAARSGDSCFARHGQSIAFVGAGCEDHCHIFGLMGVDVDSC